MTDLSETALAFCKECLGWKQPFVSPTGQPFICKGASTTFGYTDLSAVMQAVRGWITSDLVNAEALFMCDQGGKYKAAIHKPWFWQIESILLDHPCHALLWVCVEANRKLKEQE